MKLQEQVEIMMTYSNKILGLNLSEDDIIRKIEFDVECDIKEYFIMLDYYQFLIKQQLK